MYNFRVFQYIIFKRSKKEKRFLVLYFFFCVCGSHSVESDSATLWTAARQAPLSMDIPVKNSGTGCRFLFQGIFLTRGSNLGLLHCRWMLYHLSHQGRPLSTYLQKVPIRMCSYYACQTSVPYYPFSWCLSHLFSFIKWVQAYLRVAWMFLGRWHTREMLVFSLPLPLMYTRPLQAPLLWLQFLTFRESDSTLKLMLSNCGVGENSWESLGLQGDQTSPS